MMLRTAQRALPNGLKLGRGNRVSACKQSDIVALLDEGFSEPRNDTLGASEGFGGAASVSGAIRTIRIPVAINRVLVIVRAGRSNTVKAMLSVYD